MQITLGDIIRQAPLVRCGDADYPVLSMTMHNGIMLQSNRFKKSLASKDRSAYKVVQRGQLVVGFPIDEGVLYIQDAIDAGIMSPAYGVWDIAVTDVDAKYLELYLHSPFAMDYYKTHLRGTTARRRSLPTETLLALPIIVPSIEKQKEIIKTMQLVNALISLRKQQIAKLDELVKAQFVELFENEEYEKAAVSSVLNTGFWLMPATPEFVVNGEVPYITSKNIKNRTIDFDNVKYISREAYKSISANRPTQKGDILISMIGTLGQTAVIQDDREFYGQNLYLLRLDNTIVNTTYFCEFFNSDTAQYELQGKRNQSTQAYLKANHVEDLILPLPPMKLQEQFAAFVEQTDKSKLTIQHSLAKLEMTKKALMQKYFG